MKDTRTLTPSGRTLEAALEDALEQVRAMKRGDDIGATTYDFWTPPDVVNVAPIRHAMGLTQEQFAARYGFSLSGLKKWESGDRTPEAGTRTLLALIARDHGAVDALLASARG